jgi:hypothetical protein
VCSLVRLGNSVALCRPCSQVLQFAPFRAERPKGGLAAPFNRCRAIRTAYGLDRHVRAGPFIAGRALCGDFQIRLPHSRGGSPRNRGTFASRGYLVKIGDDKFLFAQSALRCATCSCFCMVRISAPLLKCADQPSMCRQRAAKSLVSPISA